MSKNVLKAKFGAKISRVRLTSTRRSHMLRVRLGSVGENRAELYTFKIIHSLQKVGFVVVIRVGLTTVDDGTYVDNSM